MDLGTGCCGGDLRRNEISLFGLLSLSLPLVFLSGALLVLSFPFFPVPIVKKTHQKLRIVLRANLTLIHQQALVPKFRSYMAACLFRISPRLSGWVYRSFNFCLLSAIYIVVLSPILIFKG